MHGSEGGGTEQNTTTDVKPNGRSEKHPCTEVKAWQENDEQSLKHDIGKKKSSSISRTPREMRAFVKLSYIPIFYMSAESHSMWSLISALSPRTVRIVPQTIRCHYPLHDISEHYHQLQSAASPARASGRHSEGIC